MIYQPNKKDMIKKITQILSAIAIVLLVVSCKNTKQKLQEYVTTYNSTSASYIGNTITGTTARGYLEDNKIEIRIETDLEQTESNKQTYSEKFPNMLVEMIQKGQLSKELIEEGVSFHVYFLANDNTVLAKEIINKEELGKLLKSNSPKAE